MCSMQIEQRLMSLPAARDLERIVADKDPLAAGAFTSQNGDVCCLARIRIQHSNSMHLAKAGLFADD